jgi:hypothetical protein
VGLARDARKVCVVCRVIRGRFVCFSFSLCACDAWYFVCGLTVSWRLDNSSTILISSQCVSPAVKMDAKNFSPGVSPICQGSSTLYRLVLLTLIARGKLETYKCLNAGVLLSCSHARPVDESYQRTPPVFKCQLHQGLELTLRA